MDPVLALLAFAVLAVLARLVALGVARHRQLRAPSLAAAADQRALRAREGGAPDSAIAVDSAAVIEPRVVRTPCPRCGGHVHVVEHGAALVDDHRGTPRRLRRVLARCSPCGRSFETWFEVRGTQLD